MKTINNNIEEQRVGFDNAFLLKEKGFTVPCNTHTFISNTNKIVEETSIHCIDWGNRDLTKTVQKYSTPTQQLAIDWLQINFDIYIHANCVAPYDYEDKINPYPKLVWVSKVFSLYKYRFEKFINTDNGLAFNHFHSPEEAKEAAINYALINLI